MGLFGKLLEKKNCDICGEEIKLLGNKKLEDGNLCKSCASKLSPWFDDRRHSTVQQIREQLDYREANRSRVQAFNTTLSIGNSGMKLLADENARVFMVTGSRDFAKDNPDVVDFSHITGCDLDIRENRNELKQKVDGKSVSYNPPRYEYSYDFHAEIRVNEPWFDKMRFPLNSGSVRTGERCMTGAATSGWRVKADGIGMRERMATEEYYKYIDMGNDLKERVEEWRTGTAATIEPAGTAEAQPQAANPAGAAAPQGGSWVCGCGATNTGKFCEYCGSPRP